MSSSTNLTGPSGPPRRTDGIRPSLAASYSQVRETCSMRATSLGLRRSVTTYVSRSLGMARSAVQIQRLGLHTPLGLQDAARVLRSPCANDGRCRDRLRVGRGSTSAARLLGRFGGAY